jgi:hypothetical protein
MMYIGQKLLFFSNKHNQLDTHFTFTVTLLGFKVSTSDGESDVCIKLIVFIT